jgi:hypothetical protein
MSARPVESPGMRHTRRRARFTALAAVAALAVGPAGAAAQNGAGDDQYSDPFAGTTTTKATAPKPTVTPMPQGRSKASTPAATEPAPATAAQRPVATGTEAQAAGPRLANTGHDVRVLLLAGVALMACGTALHARLRLR